MHDPTEPARRVMAGELNAEAAELADNPFDDPRVELEKRYGQLWDTKEMQVEFSVSGFMAPFVGVTRKSDGVRGTLAFSHHPRFYHSFTPE
jgi:hypothetical protein